MVQPSGTYAYDTGWGFSINWDFSLNKIRLHFLDKDTGFFNYTMRKEYDEYLIDTGLSDLYSDGNYRKLYVKNIKYDPITDIISYKNSNHHLFEGDQNNFKAIQINPFVTCAQYIIFDSSAGIIVDPSYGIQGDYYAVNNCPNAQFTKQ